MRNKTYKGKGHFLSVNDLMELTGASYITCYRNLRKLKKELNKSSEKVLIAEYCELRKVDFDKVWQILR